MGNGNYRTWEPLTAPVLELGEVLGLAHGAGNVCHLEQQ